MSQDHIAMIRNGCTLAEMTQITLPSSRIDPIIKQQLPNFHIHSNKKLKSSKQQTFKENEKSFDPKSLPSSHYIEERFYPYSKAKITNRPLFNTPNAPQYSSVISTRSVSVTKYHTSKFPVAPLTKELSSKVETLNSFRELDKKGLKKTITSRPCSNISISRKSFRSDKILVSMQTWERVKKEKPEGGKVESEANESSGKVRRPQSENHYRSAVSKGRRIEWVNTIESGSSVLSPMAPIYIGSKMVPQSPNVVIYPYARYGHLFE